MLESKNPLVNMIFSANDKASNGVNNKGKQAGKLTFISVGSKFRGQLAILLDKLKSTVSVNLGFVYIGAKATSLPNGFVVGFSVNEPLLCTELKSAGSCNTKYLTFYSPLNFIMKKIKFNNLFKFQFKYLISNPRKKMNSDSGLSYFREQTSSVVSSPT